MVSRRNYAAITAVMAIIFFLFQFLNMAKDHWNDYSENQYAVDVNELSGADNVYVASDSDELDQQSTGLIPWAKKKCVVCIGSNESNTMGEMIGNWALYMKRKISYYESISAYENAISKKTQDTPQFVLVDPDFINWDDTKQIRSLQTCVENGISVIFGKLPDASIIESHKLLRRLLGIDEIVAKINENNAPVVFLGDGVPVYRQMLEEGLEVPYSFAPSYMNRQRAAVVGALGIAYYYAGKYETAEAHKPDYLRVSQAERERAQREKEAKTEVREMTIEDGAVVAEIEHQSFSDAWSEKAILETLEQNNSVCFVAEKAGKRVGYLLGYTAVDEVEIARIAVIDEMKRQGVGHALMLALKAWSKEHQIAKVLLDVRESNQAAGAFYAREGFVNDGVRKAFYQDPKEDAVLMSLEIDK